MNLLLDDHAGQSVHIVTISADKLGFKKTEEKKEAWRHPNPPPKHTSRQLVRHPAHHHSHHVDSQAPGRSTTRPDLRLLQFLPVSMDLEKGINHSRAQKASKQQAANSKQQAASSQQPPASSQQRQQQAASSQQPAASTRSQQQAASSKQPAASSKQPAASRKQAGGGGLHTARA